MDQEHLEEMARVYVTDPGCKAAVDRYRAKNDVSLVEAAQEVAKTVPPAPHNVEAGNARYLLAPEAEVADEKLLAEDWTLDMARRHQQEGPDEPEEGNEGIGPIPPHPEEALDDRVLVAVSLTMTAEEFELFRGTRGCETSATEHHHSRGCELLHEFNEKLDEAKRIPVEVPRLHIRKSGENGDQRVRLSALCVPARRREVVIQLSFGDKTEVDAEVKHFMEIMEQPHMLSDRLVVRRSKRYTMHAIFRPQSDGPEMMGAGFFTQEEFGEMLGAMLGLSSDQITTMLASGPGVFIAEMSPQGETVEMTQLQLNEDDQTWEAAPLPASSENGS